MYMSKQQPSTLATFDLEQRLSGGFQMPTRMTALGFGSGGVALVSPVPIDDAMAGKIAELGEVRYLVAPNLLHHLYLAAAKARYPEARILAPRKLGQKRPDLRIDAFLEDGVPSDLKDDVRAVRIDGAPAVDEVALFHAPTRTLVLTDLVFNVTKPRGLVAHLVLFLVGCRAKLAQSRTWRFFVKDRVAAAASVRTLLTLPFDTLVVAHGEVVHERAKEALQGALRWMERG